MARILLDMQILFQVIMAINLVLDLHIIAGIKLANSNNHTVRHTYSMYVISRDEGKNSYESGLENDELEMEVLWKLDVK